MIHLPHNKFKRTLSVNQRANYSNLKKEKLFEKYQLAELKEWMKTDTINIKQV
jgi:hypothetical protein